MSFVQNLIIIAVQPNNVAAPNKHIQTTATGGTPTIDICAAPPVIIKRPAMIVIPSTMLGMASLTGGAWTN
jgi:hypothetical protein